MVVNQRSCEITEIKIKSKIIKCQKIRILPITSSGLPRQPPTKKIPSESHSRSIHLQCCREVDRSITEREREGGEIVTTSVRS